MVRSMRRAPVFLIVFFVSFVLAQAENIRFDVEIYRVDESNELVPADQVDPGDILEYRITATNDGDIIYRPRTVVVKVPVGDGVSYLGGTATPTSEQVTTEFSADGGETFFEPPVRVNRRAADPEDYDAIRWTFKVRFEPGQEERLTYRARADEYLVLRDLPGRGRAPDSTRVEGFRFDRLSLLDAGSGFVQLVGEVTSPTRYERVTFRVTLYDGNNAILATDTFVVEAVGPSPRVFDTLVSRVDATLVADFGLQVERAR